MAGLFDIENRRYIGNKNKLNDWIIQTVKQYTNNVSSFCDIFSGTGTVAKHALPYFSTIIINDFLYSNRVIYGAFFEQGEFNMDKLHCLIDEFNTRDYKADNWFSLNYGNLYFDIGVARKAGAIRMQIENMKDELTYKEYCILLASLIYSLDRLANTVGHFESYIKKPIERKKLYVRLVNARSFDNVKIYREDANVLARQINADVVYIDPPYNSRQYSRFYHVYETLVKWDKPQLFGVARKPEPENMSEYCRSSAPSFFLDLIQHLNARYIVVSYNNTYNSHSKSSLNKITLEQIKSTLEMRGKTTILTHRYSAFNAGKTDLKNHQEYLFFTKIKNNIL